MEINNKRRRTTDQQILDKLSTTQKRLHLLVIDDDPSDSELYSHYLLSDTEFAYELTCVENGEDGLAALRANNYDCVLLDFNLPDFTGIELIAMINEASNSRIPILMLTGAGSEDIAVEAMRAGAADYLPKRLVSADSLKLTIVMAMDKFETINAINLKTQRLERINADVQLKQEVIERLHHSASNDNHVHSTSVQNISSQMLGDAEPLTDNKIDSNNYGLTHSEAINDELHSIPHPIKSGNRKYNIE